MTVKHELATFILLLTVSSVSAVQLGGNTTNLDWATIPGGSYRLVSNTNLLTTNWTVVGSYTSAEVTVSITPSLSDRFYRVIKEALPRASQVFDGRLTVMLQDISSVTNPKGVKQAVYLENESTNNLYFQFDVQSPLWRVMLMCPQPNRIFLDPGEVFQGMLVFEAPQGATSGPVTLDYSLSFLELSQSDGSSSGQTNTLTTNTSFTLQATPALPVVTQSTTRISYTRTQAITTPTGFWDYGVDGNHTRIVLFPGQENWTTSSAKTTSVMYCYTPTGTQLWSRALGNETWAGDLSRDGAYVAYAPLQDPALGTNRLFLLNATNGSELWNMPLIASNLPTPANADMPVGSWSIDTRAVRISPGSHYIAMGTIWGRVYLMDRATATPIWGFETRGQVRGLTFDSAESNLFIGSGDGYLYKVRVSDAAQLWKASILAWPYTAPHISPDGSMIAAGSKTGEMTVLGTANGNRLFRFDYGLMTTRRVIFTPDGQSLIGASGSPLGTRAFSTADWATRWITGMSAGLSCTTNSQYALISDGGSYLIETATGLSVAEPDPGFAAGANYFKVVYISGDGENIIIARRDTSPGATNLVFFARE